LEKDEAVDMAQFEGRKMVEVSEKKENAGKYKRTLSLFADAVVCHNEKKFKWFRPMSLLQSMKTSKSDNDLLILEWRAGAEQGYSLNTATTVQLVHQNRDLLIQMVKNRFSYVKETAEMHQAPRAHQAPAPAASPAAPAYASGANRRTQTNGAFELPPAYQATTNVVDAELARTLNGSTRPAPGNREGPFNTVNVDCEGLISRATALGYPEGMVRAALQELQQLGGPIDINRLLDKMG